MLFPCTHIISGFSLASVNCQQQLCFGAVSWEDQAYLNPSTAVLWQTVHLITRTATKWQMAGRAGSWGCDPVHKRVIHVLGAVAWGGWDLCHGTQNSVHLHTETTGSETVNTGATTIQGHAKVGLQLGVHNTQCLFLYNYWWIIVLSSTQTNVILLLPTPVLCKITYTLK